jgi:outer membrane protein assembly factor BamB
MIRFSKTCQEQNTRSPLSFTKAGFSNSNLFGSFALKVSLLTLIALGSWGCSSRQIHPDLKEDSRIMVRRWTLPTHGPFEAGDHGTEFSNPVIVDNALVFGNRSVGLVSLYPKINQQRWALPIPGGVVSELAVDGQSVFFGGGDGFIYSVNLESGQVNWRYEVRNPIVSRPTLDEGKVFVTTSDDTIYAFDAASGKWLWHYPRRSSQLATIYGASAPLVDGNEVITGLSDGFLVALSVQEGQLKWEKRLHQASKFTDVNAHPVLENGIIYVPSYDGALYALKRKDGEIIWRFDAGGSKSVVMDDQHLILPSSDGSVYALQKNNSKIIWRFELDHGTPTNAVVTEKYVIVASSHQYLYVIDKKNGKGLYRFNVGSGSGFYGSPAFDPVEQRVYILSNAGNLYAFSLRKPPRKVRKHGMTDPYDFSIETKVY